MHIIMDSDSCTAVSLIVEGCDSTHQCSNLVSEIKELLRSKANVNFCHARETNQVGDVLAKTWLAYFCRFAAV